MAANEEELGKLRVKVEATLNEYQADMDKLKMQSEKTVKSLQNSFNKLNGFFGRLGIALGITTIIKLMKDSVKAAAEQEAAENKLTAALGRRSRELIKYAASLQRVTKFGDESIIQAQASIAAFTKEESKIKALTKSTLDFASAKGMSLVQAAELLSKTFGSSTNALSRYGVEVEGAAGSSERLQSITESIQKLFGGMAEAEAKTFSGRLEQIKNQVGDLSEKLGFELIPALENLGSAFGSVEAAGEKVSPVFKLIGSAALVASQSIVNIINMVKLLGNVWVNAGKAIAATVKGDFGEAFNIMKNNVGELIDNIGNYADANVQAFNRIKDLWKDPEKYLPSSATFNFKTGKIEPLPPNAKGEVEDQLKSYTKIVKEIEELNERLNEENLSLEEAADITNQIAEKTKQITFGIKDSNSEIDETIKKLQTEIGIKKLTNDLSMSILQSAKKTLEATLAITTDEEKRLKLLNAINLVDKEIEERRSKNKEVKPAAEITGAKGAGIPVNEDQVKAEKERLNELQELKLHNITNEFDQREARINAEYDLLLKKYSGNAEMISEIEKARQIDLQRLEQDRFSNMLSMANQIGDILTNKLGIAGHTFVGQLLKALDIANDIFSMINQARGNKSGVESFLDTFFGIAGIVMSFAGPMADGGPVERNRIYKVGEHGVEFFKPGTSGVIIPNHEIPNGINRQIGNSSLGISSDGVITRLLAIENAIRTNVSAVQAMNQNLVEKDFSIEVHNNAPQVKTTVRTGEKIKTSLDRSGVDFNER